MPRETASRSILGEATYKKVRETPILVVGAGGIGCELLKNLVLVGFADIEIIDLDTIDLSNLNRQFLFRKPDISKSKSLVAAASARHFNPSSGIKIHARHGNVKDAVNDIEWIKGFGLVLNALDNRDARSHVNRLCQAAQVPLIESGTAGYLGQVQPHINGETECYECRPKPAAQKTYPVCTLRATPSEPIHCIVWAKSYLFGKLYGEDDEVGDDDELNKAQADGENAEEIENLKKEAAAFRAVRRDLGEEDGPRKVFDKVFKADIERLLAMDDLWNKAGRVKPTALDYDTIMDGSFVPPPLRTAASAAPPLTAAPTANGASTSADKGFADGAGGAKAANGQAVAVPPKEPVNAAQLKDQRELSVKENLELFIDSCRRLSARAIAHPDVILSFDKDDADTLDFVLTTSNLRSIAYGIPTKTRFQVKEMAGNIIPAIATTNAVIAGFIVMAAVRVLSGQGKPLGASLRSNPARPISVDHSQAPNQFCSICKDTYVPFKVDTATCTLGQFVTEIVKGWLQGAVPEGGAGEETEWIVLEGGRILADPDFDDNHEKTLDELGIERGKMITVQDEDLTLRPIHFCVCEPTPNAELSYTLPELPEITIKPIPPQPEAKKADPDIVEIDSIPVKIAKVAPVREEQMNGSGDTEVAKQVAGKKRAEPEGDVAEAGQAAGSKRRKVEEIIFVDDDE